MTTFTIDIGLGHLLRGAPVTKEVFPALSKAVRDAAQEGQNIWVGFASGNEPLPGGGRLTPKTDRYLRSIKTRSVTDFDAEIYSDVAYATAIEHGWPSRDLKKMLNTSLKVRRSKKGKRYLIIPFRHGTPGTVTFQNSMPTKELHDTVKHKDFLPSSIVGVGFRQSGQKGKGHIRVRSRHYKWGSRLTGGQLSAAGVFGKQERHMIGMVKMQNRAGFGGGKHTQYLTFRVMTEDSKGWITKAKPGYYPARTTSEQLQRTVKKKFEAAVEADVKFFLGMRT